ncbi:MAG: hypothetical protein DHS80DRAFT_24785 [Piptocephalis tieghemiana]|nr:MAG: hypothetical protein DHS80DRAFT_24785 [Piptocephalis tieghemiana]
MLKPQIPLRSLHRAAAIRPMGVYIHWPYCAAKCPYCAFNKYARASKDQEDRIERALVREAEYTVRSTSPGQEIRSVYFGGGTPSLMSIQGVSSTLDALRQGGSMDPAAEVTMESMPEEKLRSWRDMGVNRLSIGVQSFNSRILSHLGRDHTAKEAVDSIDLANKIFPGRVSLDLIFGSFSQSLSEWKDDIQASGFGPLPPLSMFKAHAPSSPQIVPIPDIEDMYEEAVQMYSNLGYEHYEVSSYARSSAYRGQHNSGYWMGLDYHGIGPGAHGRITMGPGIRKRTFRIPEPKRWSGAVERMGEGLAREMDMTTEEIAHEMITLGLRSKEGISPERFMHYVQSDLDRWLEKESVDACIQGGYLKWLTPSDRPGHPIHLVPTERGLALLDSLVPQILSPSPPQICEGQGRGGSQGKDKDALK